MKPGSNAELALHLSAVAVILVIAILLRVRLNEVSEETPPSDRQVTENPMLLDSGELRPFED